MNWELICAIVPIVAGSIWWAVRVVFQLGRIAQALEQALTHQAETLKLHAAEIDSQRTVILRQDDAIRTNTADIDKLKPRVQRIEQLQIGGGIP